MIKKYLAGVFALLLIAAVLSGCGASNDKQFIRDTQFDKAMHVLSENEAKLTGLLEGREKKLFLDLVNAQSEVNGVTGVESFIEGFRLGARIAIEIMNEEEGCLVDID